MALQFLRELLLAAAGPQEAEDAMGTRRGSIVSYGKTIGTIIELLWDCNRNGRVAAAVYRTR
jgi:hypothetical protein